MCLRTGRPGRASAFPARTGWNIQLARPGRSSRETRNCRVAGVNQVTFYASVRLDGRPGCVSGARLLPPFQQFRAIRRRSHRALLAGTARPLEAPGGWPGGPQKLFSGSGLSPGRGGNRPPPARSRSGGRTRPSSGPAESPQRARLDLTVPRKPPNVSSCPRGTGRRQGGTPPRTSGSTRPAHTNPATGRAGKRLAVNTECSESERVGLADLTRSEPPGKLAGLPRTGPEGLGWCASAP
jgi:hypothetical protein